MAGDPPRRPLPGIPTRHLPDRDNQPAVRPPEPRHATPPEPPSSPEAASVPQQRPMRVERGPESSRRSVFARADVHTLWAAAGRWSPAGIAAGLLIVFLALGGREGVVALASGLSESMSGARALTAEMAALRTEIAGLSKRLDRERDQRQDLSAELGRTQHNLSLVCDLASQLNGGRPEQHWCSADGRSIRFEPPPRSGTRIPTHLTSAQWRHRPQR
jgi:hypothetical protein